MKIVPFAEVDEAEWDAVTSASHEAWLFHSRAWVDIEATFFWEQNLSFGVSENQRLVAIQPLYLGSYGLGAWTERLIHSGLHRHTGLARASDLNTGQLRAARSEAMRHILLQSETLDADRIQLNAQNLAPAGFTYPREDIPYWVSDHGFQHGLAFGPSGFLPAPGSSTCNADQIVDLTPPEDDLFQQLDEGCRRAVRKAVTAGLHCEPASGASAVTDYYELAQKSAQRTGEKLAGENYYAQIWRAFAPAGRCAVLIVRLDSKPVAALFLLVEKGSAHFLGGVSDPEFLSLRVNDFMHWSAMVWCRSRGLVRYRLGPCFPDLPREWPIVKVSRFKEKFGGLSIPVLQGSLFRRPEKYLAGGRSRLDQLTEALGRENARRGSQDEPGPRP